MTPVPKGHHEEPEVHHPNPSINLSEMYGSMNHEDSFVQVAFEHEHDNDDIVPELTENVVLEHKIHMTDSRKTDFAGDRFTEDYAWFRNAELIKKTKQGINSHSQNLPYLRWSNS